MAKPLPILVALIGLLNSSHGYLFPRWMEELAEANGFEYENHTLTTEDGYILNLGRLPPRSHGCTSGKGLVLLGHGLRNNGELHMVQPDSLAYRLAKECYDVWLINNRGTRYSNKHVKLTTADRDYWDFANDEMALHDMKSTIDYMRNVCGHKQKIHYAGFSQSTSHFLMLCSEKPEYQNYIHSAHLLAPVMSAHNTEEPRWIIQSKIMKKLIQIPELINRPVLTTDGTYSSVVLDVCSHDKPVCRKFEKKKCPSQMDSSIWGTHFPDAFPFRAIAEFLQWKYSDKFQKFDFGKERNLRQYGQPNAPVFDITKIQTKTIVYYALGDPYCTPEDARLLVGQLPNGVLHAVSQNRSSHGDCPSDSEMGIERLDTKVVQHVNELNEVLH